MNRTTLRGIPSCSVLIWILVAGGCGSSTAPAPADSSQRSAAPGAGEALDRQAARASGGSEQAARKRHFQPVQLTGRPAPSAGEDSTHQHGDARQVDNVLEAMQPLQVVLGTWRAITNKAVGDFKAVDEVQWVWDFRTDPRQPALAMTSQANPYFQSGRLTYHVGEKQYRLTAVDQEDRTRTFVGVFAQEPQEFQGDDRQLHRSFKLELTETAGDADQERWRLVFNQQENNRYLLELSRERGSGRFFRFDTVSNQREGTSFALSDTDFKEKTCIISQGLGTIQVSHQGKSYWVCCTGCKAAFEEDPKRWIARQEKRAVPAE